MRNVVGVDETNRVVYFAASGMLMVGEMDDNVDRATTMQIVNALIKAKKEFELVVVPRSNHTLGGEYGDRKRLDFFVKHLLGITPPDWNNQ